MYGYYRGGGKMYGEIVENIAKYMAKHGNRSYSHLVVSAIGRAIREEYNDRVQTNTQLMGWGAEGKKIIYKRVVEFLHQRGFKHLTVQDVILYKKCWSLEKYDRKKSTGTLDRQYKKKTQPVTIAGPKK